MRATSGATKDLVLWQDVRARAIDAHLGSDRRAVGERVTGWLRWLFLVAFALAVASKPVTVRSLMSAALLLAWAIAGLVLTVALQKGWRPSRLASIATLAADFAVGTSLVYLSLGSDSLIGLAFFLVVIGGAIRLGIAATLGAALAASLMAGIAHGSADPFVAGGQVFMFISVALVVGLMSQELERERRVAISRAAQADAMHEMSVSLGASLDLKDVFAIVLQHALRLSAADAGGLVLVFEDSVEVAAGDPLEEAAARAVANHGDADYGSEQKRLLVPLASGEGVTAVLGLHRDARPFSSEDLFTVRALAGSVAVPLGNALRYRRSTQEAASDAVTGLLNHREMLRRLDAELAWRRDSGREMAFVLIDIDHFKEVNDSMGHQHGDQVLRQAAKLVRDTVRAHDLVARYGGDELAVIVLDTAQEGADALAERLLAAVRGARITTSPSNQLTLSLGIATFPADALTAEELVMAADQALYVSKRGGRDRATTCGQLVERVARDPAALLAMLKDAGPQVALPVGHALDRHLATPGRSSAVAVLAGMLGARAGIGADADSLRAAAFVEDVGRLSGLDGTEGGAQLLHEAGFPAAVVAAVRHRDERWDGKGGPGGLAGAAIPPEARTIAVAAAFELAVSGRDGKAVSPAQAVDALAGDAGAFDPVVLGALSSIVEEQALPPLPAPAVGRRRTANTATIPPTPAAASV